MFGGVDEWRVVVSDVYRNNRSVLLYTKITNDDRLAINWTSDGILNEFLYLMSKYNRIACTNR